MAQVLHTRGIRDEAREFRWHALYQIGGVAGLITVVLIAISIVVFIVWPPPDTVVGHLARFQENWILGLLSMDLLYLLSNVVAIPMWLALYIVLRRVDEARMLLAVVLTFMGTMALFTTVPVVEMLVLSQRYAAATNEIHRVTLLAAGETLLATYQGTTYHLHYILGAVGLLIISMVMLRSAVFSKATAYVGIATNVIAFGLYVPAIGIALSALSGIGYWIWFVLITRRLLQLGNGEHRRGSRSTQSASFG